MPFAELRLVTAASLMITFTFYRRITDYIASLASLHIIPDIVAASTLFLFPPLMPQ